MFDENYQKLYCARVVVRKKGELNIADTTK